MSPYYYLYPNRFNYFNYNRCSIVIPTSPRFTLQPIYYDLIFLPVIFAVLYRIHFKPFCNQVYAKIRPYIHNYKLASKLAYTYHLIFKRLLLAYLKILNYEQLKNTPFRIPFPKQSFQYIIHYTEIYLERLHNDIENIKIICFSSNIDYTPIWGNYIENSLKDPNFDTSKAYDQYITSICKTHHDKAILKLIILETEDPTPDLAQKIESNDNFIKSLIYTTYYLTPADYKKTQLRPFSMLMMKGTIFYPELYQARFQTYTNYLLRNHSDIYYQLELKFYAQCQIDTTNYFYDLNHYSYLYKLSQNEHLLERIQVIHNIEVLDSYTLKKIRLSLEPIHINTTKVLINEPTYQLVIYNSFRKEIEIIKTPFLELISDRRNLQNLNNTLQIYQLHLAQEEPDDYIYSRNYTWHSFTAKSVVYTPDLSKQEKCHYINCQSHYYYSYADQSTFTNFHREVQFTKTDKIHRCETVHFFKKLQQMTTGKNNTLYLYIYYLKRYRLIVLNSIRKTQGIRKNLIRVIQSQYFHKFNLYKKLYQPLYKYQSRIQLFYIFINYYKHLYKDRIDNKQKKQLLLTIYQLQPIINTQIHLPLYIKLYPSIKLKPRKEIRISFYKRLKDISPIKLTPYHQRIVDQEMQIYEATGFIQPTNDTLTYKKGIFIINKIENNNNRIENNNDKIENNDNKIGNNENRIGNNENRIEKYAPTLFSQMRYINQLIEARQIIQVRKTIIITELENIHIQYLTLQVKKYNLMHKYNQIIFGDQIPTKAQIDQMQRDIENIALKLIALRDKSRQTEHEFKHILTLQDSIIAKEQTENARRIRLQAQDSQLIELIDSNNDLLLDWNSPSEKNEEVLNNINDPMQILLTLNLEHNITSNHTNDDEKDDEKNDEKDDISPSYFKN